MKNIKTHIKKIPYVADSIRAGRRMLWGFRKSINTPWGFSLIGNPEMASGRFEIDEVNFFQKEIKNFDVLINVGANIGMYTCMGLYCGKNVIAFEPHPHNYKLLLENVFVNGFECAEVHKTALSNRVGYIKLYGSGTGASLVKGWNSQSRYIIVPVNTIDNIIGNRYEESRILLWMDVEGAELNVFKGMNNLIGRSNVQFVVEICLEEHTPDLESTLKNTVELIQIMRSKGYVMFNLSDSERAINYDSYLYNIKNNVDISLSQTYIFKRV